jgi:hypothetical protein
MAAFSPPTLKDIARATGVLFHDGVPGVERFVEGGGADDGTTQVVLPVPDGARVSAVVIGGKDGDILFAFCMDKIWKRKIQQHAMGAFTPWTKVTPNKL